MVFVLEMLPELLFESEDSVAQRTPFIFLVDLNVFAQVVLVFEDLTANLADVVHQHKVLRLNMSLHGVLVLGPVTAILVIAHERLLFQRNSSASATDSMANDNGSDGRTQG